MGQKSSVKKIGNMNSKSAVRYLEILKRFFVYIGLLSLLGILVSLLGVFFALVSKRVIDVATGQVAGIVFKEITALVLLASFQLFLQVVTSKLYVVSAGRIEIYIKNKFFSELLQKNAVDLEKYKTGDLLNLLNADVSVVVSAVVDIVPTAIGLSVRLALSVIALFYLDKSLAILLIICLPVILLISGVFRKRLKLYHKDYLKCEGSLRSFMIEAFSSIYVIKSFIKERFFSARLRDYQEKSYKMRMKKNDFSILTSTLFFAMVTLGYYIALGWGAYRISAGVMTFGTLTAVLELIGQIDSPIQSLSSLVPQWFSASASLERLAELENLENDGTDEAPSEKSLDWTRIDFSCVSFRYEEISILNGFSASVPRGSVVALTGESGVGKTTVFKLLLGFLKANSGEITLVKEDGTKYFVNSGTRNMFAYVPQVNLLMSGTVAQNIAFGNLVDYEKLEKCAKLAELDGVVQSLPRGFETELGENGIGLSEGEGQRIAIARALYADKEILLMDEGTSALDDTTERKILRNIKELGKTCIMISHRDSVLDVSDMTIDFGRKKRDYCSEI